MSKTADWTAVTDYDDVLVRKDGNRRITKSSFATAISASLVTAGFIKSTTVLSKLSTVSTAVNLTLTNSNVLVFVDCSGASRSIVLPASATLWDSVNSITNVLIIKRIDAHASNVCTITPDGSETIDGAATLTLSGTNYPFALLVTNGTNLFTIG